MKQQISECMDGELDTEGAARILGQVAGSAELHADWVIYHMVGDGMRDTPDLSPGFAARFAERLAQEPTVLAPRPSLLGHRSFTQFAMYAAAALSAVAVVGWFALTPQLTATSVATTQSPVVPVAKVAVQQRPAVSPLKPRDHDYLLAHQAVSPGAMPGVAAYVYTVSLGPTDQ
jgi:sigma-E factor negative regulatory protein RseA